MSYFKITRPDGVSFASDLTYSVTDEEIKIYGLVEGYTKIEAQYMSLSFSSEGNEADISINQDGTWVLPNSNEGLDLDQGINTFLFSATDANGNTASLSLLVILPNETTLEAPNPPTDIRALRGNNQVGISWLHSDSSISSYNVYASTSSGGGSQGYVRINALPLDPISYGQPTEKVTPIAEISSDIKAEEADPLTIKLKSSQNDLTDVVLGSASIPENTKRLRVSSVVSSTTLETRVSFSHNRGNNITSTPPTIPVGTFSTILNTTPLYYVVTSVKFTGGEELESIFSVETSGNPIDITASNLGLPTTSDDELTQELLSYIYNSDPDASVQAGSAIRDLFVDPVISEISRTRFVLDFCYRSTNFISLLGIDDPLDSGSSIPVSSSSYKQTLKDALFVDTDSQLQNLINQCFERLAGNLGISRREGVKARGEVIFFTSSTPTFDLDIPQGTVVQSGSTRFVTVSPASISSVNSAKYYNPLAKRYETTVSIEAQDVGSASNLTSGKITTGAPLGLLVANSAPTFGGLDRETNRDLTSRSLSYISSTDSGTKAGYERVARESAGVESYFVVGANDPYMIRDNGIGGKVDVWVRGEVLNEVTDVYAPSYQSVRNAKFIPLYGEGSYVFQATTATTDSPLFQMIDRVGEFGLKNQTTGDFFDLTNASITEGRVLTLDATVTQPTYRLTDNILGDYRTDVTRKVILERQPVTNISSIAKSDGTAVAGYTFYKSEDPLLLGQSTKAQDYVILNNDGSTKVIDVAKESVNFNGQYPEALINKGVDLTSVKVYNQISLTEYSSQLKSSTPDFNVYTDESGITQVQRTSNSTIADKESVFVDYEHLENITITYNTNLVLSTLQNKIDEEKHMGADVVVKEVTSSPIDVKAFVYIEKNSDPAEIDSIVRANLIIRIESEGQGGRIYSSDVIKEIDSVVGVSHVEVPLLQLALSPNTLILRELLNTTAPSIISEIESSSHQVWICDLPLAHVPSDSGGDGAKLFLDGVEYSLLNSVQRTNPSNWSSTLGSIVGKEGARVNVDGVLTLIANASQKLMVSLPLGKTPSDYKIELNYRTGSSPNYVNSISLNQFSYMTSGEFSFTYEELRG